MEFFAYSSIGLIAFLPSILLLFGIYLIWEQTRLLNKQLSGIARLLTAMHQVQQRRDASQRLDTNRPLSGSHSKPEED